MPSIPRLPSSRASSAAGTRPASNHSPTSGVTRSATHWRTVSRISRSSSLSSASSARKSLALIAVVASTVVAIPSALPRIIERPGLSQMSTPETQAQQGLLAWIDRDITGPIRDFQGPNQAWRRLFSELYGTFLLVLVAAGGGMMSQAFPNTISRTAAVVAPGLMVMAIIMFMGKVSGAHLNPAVSLAFALRGDFPWRRVPGYIIVQLIGATLAALFLHAVVDVSAKFGSNYPAAGYSAGSAFWMELILTLGLVSVILGTASGAQNIGIVGAFGVGGYIALAGLWGSPISGASMNPARTFGPNLVSGTWTDYWVYVAGPLAGAALAVVCAFVLRGRGGGRSGSAAAQGDLHTEVGRPDPT